MGRFIQRVRGFVAGLAVLSLAGCASMDCCECTVPEAGIATAASPPKPISQPDANGVISASAAIDATIPPTEELTSQFVVDQVLARNPTLQQMAAALAAAEARYPQVTSLDDPSFSTWVAPASLGSNMVNNSARFEVSQKLPFPGKRSLRGKAAQAQALAAGGDLEDTRLQLVESSRSALADFFLAERSLEVNTEGLKLLEEFKKNAETRYQTGQTPQQDVLQADVEIGRLGERKLNLNRTRRVAIARLNTLMNRPPDSPLPPPPKSVHVTEPIANAVALREAALARRPDLQALKARIEADQASLALAEREFYPDVEAMAAYDSFWQAADSQQRLRPQVGIRLNLPARLSRRSAAVSEASAVLAQRRAQLVQLSNQVAFEIEQAAAQVRESEQTLKLYEDRILPSARENVKAAQAAYVTGKSPFLSLIEAQRNLIELRDRFNQSSAEYAQRRAALDRASGMSRP